MTEYNPALSHALLITVLHKLGGSIELTEADLHPAVLGDPEGALHRIALEAVPDAPVPGTFRLSVLPPP